MEHCADSCVVRKLLKDDSNEWLEFPTPVVVVNRELEWAWKTTIRIEDIDR